ncbi:MAG: hypothetical protein QM644_12890 [Mobilitalea sp.]
MTKKEKRNEFHNIVKNKKLPILSLDTRWHDLFPQEEKTPEMKNLEQKVNELLKRQGKLVNDIKDLKQLKSNLMKEIVQNMDIGSDALGKAKEKKLDKNKNYINEINLKLEKSMDELADLPYEIKAVNEQLMAESIHVFYDLLEKNKQEINDVTTWINQIREELKQKILLKQDLEMKNSKIYTYMHDILGADLMESFDKEF